MDKIIYLEDAKAAVRTIIYDYNGIYDNKKSVWSNIRRYESFRWDSSCIAKYYLL